MKNITLLTTLLSVLLTAVGCSQNKVAAVWMDLPEGYKNVVRKVGGVPGGVMRGTVAETSEVKYHKGELVISVGPTYYTKGPENHMKEGRLVHMRKEDNIADYYFICVTREIGLGEVGIVELNVPMKYVSPEKLHAKANVLVKYDEASGVISINLGKTVFKCKLVKPESA